MAKAVQKKLLSANEALENQLAAMKMEGSSLEQMQKQLEELEQELVEKILEKTAEIDKVELEATQKNMDKATQKKMDKAIQKDLDNAIQNNMDKAIQKDLDQVVLIDNDIKEGLNATRKGFDEFDEINKYKEKMLEETRNEIIKLTEKMLGEIKAILRDFTPYS